MSPRSAQAFEVMREASRENIIQGALELFARYGFEKTSVRMIAEKVGISQGLMYNYFSSKEALLQTIFEESMKDIRASFAVADAAEQPEKKLEALVRGSFAIIREHRNFWLVFYSLRSQPGIAERLPADFLTWHWQIHEQLKSYLEAIGDPRAESSAWLLFAAIDGMAQHYVLEPLAYPLESVIERLLETWLKRSDNVPRLA